jgi:hypothetical protein
MTKRMRVLTLAAAIVAATSCSDKKNPVEASGTADPEFSAQLLPSNEVPAVSNGDQFGSGTVKVTLHPTRNSSGQITSATADFTVTLVGFPGGTVLTGAHIHQARAGQNAGIIWNTGLGNGEITLQNGAGSFTKTGTTITDSAVVAQNLINDPAGFYFNVHSAINLSGAARGQLGRSN